MILALFTVGVDHHATAGGSYKEKAKACWESDNFINRADQKTSNKAKMLWNFLFWLWDILRWMGFFKKE